MKKTINTMKNTIAEQIMEIKDLDTLDNMKKFIEEKLEERKAVIELCDEAKEIMKNKNFGFIKENFETLSEGLFGNVRGRSLINRYISEIKKNKTMRSVYGLYEALRKVKDPSNVTSLLREWTENNPIDKKEYSNGISKLASILAEGYIISEKEMQDKVNDDNVEYNKAVMEIAEGKMKRNDIGNYFNNVSLIKDHINETKNMRSDAFGDAIDRLEKEVLSKTESKAVSEAVDEEKEDTYRRYKDKCLNELRSIEKRLLDEGDNEGVAHIKEFIEGVEKKEFCEETIWNDVKNFEDLPKCF